MFVYILFTIAVKKQPLGSMSLFHARLSHSLFHAAVNLTQGPRSFQALVFKVKGLNNALVFALVHTLIMTAQVWFQS